MAQVGIRALKQNASAVVAEAASGEQVTITDRGRPVAQMTPLPLSRLEGMLAAGRARPARRHLLQPMEHQAPDTESAAADVGTATLTVAVDPNPAAPEADPATATCASEPAVELGAGGPVPPHLGRRIDLGLANYLHPSALLCLVMETPETAVLRAWLRAQDGPAVSCDLSRTELLRTVRAEAPERVVKARLVLDGLVLTEVTAQVFEEAGRLESTDLSHFDAVHLAAALDLGDNLGSVVVFDSGLATAAQAYGLPVVANPTPPGNTLTPSG